MDESKSTQAYLEKLKARHAASYVTCSSLCESQVSSIVTCCGRRRGFSDDPERVKMMKRQKALAARAAQWKSMRITRKW